MDDHDKTDYRRALEAIYRDAYSRGHAIGFSAGVEEKAWLSKHWPLIALAFGVVSLVIGTFIGAQIAT
jgi:hypothetical protein